jgi:hypothetical protein
MGLFDRIKAIGGRALSIGGSALKRFGDIGTKVVRTVGSLASPIQGAVSAVSSLIPGGGTIGGLINKGIGALAGAGAQHLVSKAGQWGKRAQDLSESMND